MCCNNIVIKISQVYILLNCYYVLFVGIETSDSEDTNFKVAVMTTGCIVALFLALSAKSAQWDRDVGMHTGIMLSYP